MTTYARIHRLTEQCGEDIEETFRRPAQLLRHTGRTATFRCTILVADGRRHWAFDLKGHECQLHDDVSKVPDLEIITREATCLGIAEGRLSPLEAFTQGRLRVLGDTQLGSHLLRHAADGGGTASTCGE